MLIFGLGYTATRLADRLRDQGWSVTGTTRDGRDDTLAFDDADAVVPAIAAATHILSSVPPTDASDPVLATYGATVARRGVWLGYLSSTGVYGDAGGAWVDETMPTGGRRPARTRADADWLTMSACVFRLPGIYGPARSPLERVAEGKAHRIDMPGQVFSRVHVDDIVSGVVAAIDAPAGAYNLADDEPASQNDVVAYAAMLLNMPPPAFVALDTLSPMARGFYKENRRVAAGKAKRILGWTPQHPDYRSGLRALRAMTSPMPVSTAPTTASIVQR